MRRGCATVPFVKKRQRHGRNCEAEGVTDRAFRKKSLKARSKSRGRGRGRPCLLQKTGKGTVEMAGRRAQPTVPFAKKRQRHGRNGGAEGATDRAFCKKTPKARSKLRGRGRGRPYLLQKKRQRHGRNGGAEGATDRAFCKKSLKAQSIASGARKEPAPPAVHK